MKDIGGSPHYRIETPSHSAERFTLIANNLLPAQEPDGHEQTTSWSSDDLTWRFVLSRMNDATYGRTIYTLDVYDYADTDDSLSFATYMMSDITDRQIRMLSPDGDILDDEQSNAIAAKSALAILTDKQPELAAQDLNYHVKRDFLQLIGSYLVSDKRMEKRLDRAQSLPSTTYPYNQEFTQKALATALQNFTHFIQSATAGYSNELATTIRQQDYEVRYALLAEEAVNRFVVSSARNYLHKRPRKR